MLERRCFQFHNGPYSTNSDNLTCPITRYDVAAACVKPYAVTMALEALENTDVKVCPVIGFPAGNSTTAVKVFEATEVVKDVRIQRNNFPREVTNAML